MLNGASVVRVQHNPFTNTTTTNATEMLLSPILDFHGTAAAGVMGMLGTPPGGPVRGPAALCEFGVGAGGGGASLSWVCGHGWALVGRALPPTHPHPSNHALCRSWRGRQWRRRLAALERVEHLQLRGDAPRQSSRLQRAARVPGVVPRPGRHYHVSAAGAPATSTPRAALPSRAPLACWWSSRSALCDPHVPAACACLQLQLVALHDPTLRPEH